MRSMRRSLPALGVALVAFAAGTGPALAQVGTASAVGEVRDQQAAAVPGAMVTLVNLATRAERTATTDHVGTYRFAAIAPGTYQVRVELEGFNTAVRGQVVLNVDTAARFEPIILTVGAISQVVEVQGSAAVGMTDAAMGNVIASRQILTLPLEARNPVSLMSLQPGAVFLPTGDQRSGAISGARSDQSNVTLDGVDVNDPELGTGYTTVLRVPLDAIAEFRVTTSSYGAEQGRSSGGQISLVTKSGTNVFHGAGYGVIRNTATSSNEYFLKLTQLQAGEPNKPPKLDKQIYGAALGGPIRKNRLFFYANYEHLRESSETPVTRAVPSDTLRDGILVYQCADPAACPGGTVRGVTGASHTVKPGYYGLLPAEMAAIDPLGVGPNLAMLQYWQQYPRPNDPGTEGLNQMAFRFAAPSENLFKTLVGRADYSVSGAHRLFGRVNVMRDHIEAAPQFPGQPPGSTDRVRNWGFAAGHDWVLGPTRVNTLRYGFTQLSRDSTGQLTSDFVVLRDINPLVPQTPVYSRSAPTHNITNDFSWVAGNHALRFGGNLRFTRNNWQNNISSYAVSVTNPYSLPDFGTNDIPGRSTCTLPGCTAVPAVAESFYPAWSTPYINTIGLLSWGMITYNADRDGTILPSGTTIRRRFATDEYELYAADSWRLGSTLTLNAGIRWSLYSPPWESNGMQSTPTIALGEWFDERAANAAKGIPASAMPLFQYELTGPANGKGSLYRWDYTNVAPRVSAAWTPTPGGGWLKRLTGDGHLVVRGGYALVYDRVGSALITANDGVSNTGLEYSGAFGLTTNISPPFGSVSTSTPDARFTGPNAPPPATLPMPAPDVSFPYQPPLESGFIGVGVDGSVRAPYAHVINAVVGRELPGGFSVDAAYVGRFGRRLLVRSDVATPANLVDAKTGVDYFTAAGELIKATQRAGIGVNADPSAYAVLANIPYWENLFPGAAAGGLTATQAIAQHYNTAPDYATALYMLDEYCYPSCSVFGPFAYYSRQFDALSIQRSIASANYHALQASVRKRWSRGYQFDVNYTLSKSEDLGSSVERGSSWMTPGYGGVSGVLMNPWEPDRQWGHSDFDVRHQLNLNWVAILPFGRGRTWGAGASSLVNAFIGDWSVSGLVRLTSGFPFNVANCALCWATNWNLPGNAELATPGVLPPTAVTKNGPDGWPNAYPDPEAALTYFRMDLPGEVGIRNQLRGDGYFGIDLSVSNAWSLPHGSLRFRWDTFNLSNAVNFDTSTVTMNPDRPGFGRYNSTLATCDGRAGRCMQFALHYEF